MLSVGDPLAHRALEALVRAESRVRRRSRPSSSGAGCRAAGFSVLVVLTTAGGALELRTLRRRLGWTKANATEVTRDAGGAPAVARRRLPGRPAGRGRCGITAEGVELVEALFPEHTERVSAHLRRARRREKRSLAEICRKLAA